MEEMLAAKFGTIFPHLDERQRRMLMGTEARALGHGGIRPVDPGRGRARGHGVAGRFVAGVRGGAAGPGASPGRCRKRLADSDPGLVPALLALVQPPSGVIWDRRCGGPMSTRDLAGELTAQGHAVPAETVDRLLHALDRRRGHRPARHTATAAPGTPCPAS